VRVTAQSRLPGYVVGETGTVLRITRRPHTDAVTTDVVRMDRDGIIVVFYPGEVDRA
jgi:hypothetical protein